MNNSSSVHKSDSAQWVVLRGAVTTEQILTITKGTAKKYGLIVNHFGEDVVTLSNPARPAIMVTVRWKALPSQSPQTQGYQLPPPPALEVLIDSEYSPLLTQELYEHISAATFPYTGSELESIVAGMPLVYHYSSPTPVFDTWALLFRDHYLEHSVGFLLAMERAGIPAEWIYALDKGDSTFSRDRVHATFLERGYRSGLLDNAAINDPATCSTDLDIVSTEIDAFINAAHTAGRKVLVIDDGGLLMCGYGAANNRSHVDAALELTVSGNKRIMAAGPLAVPVLNMARSQVKTLLGYREIADSCVRRMRTILPDQKFIGRQVLLIGYGTLGSHLAPALRALGCRISIVDTDLPTLISAAESGYTTYRSADEALHATTPFLVIGTTGETALSYSDIELLPDGVYLAPFATRDFSLFSDSPDVYDNVEIPGVGMRFRSYSGHIVTLLGNGRSMNLFESDSIPNQGYDAYRAGTLIAAGHLCSNSATIPAGLHTAPADDAITHAGLFQEYYDLYIGQHEEGEQTPSPARTCDSQVTNACVIGYGHAGHLHTKILADIGIHITVLDPKCNSLPQQHHSFPCEVSELPTDLATNIDLWSICCPTADHLPALKAILAHNPASKILLEKPACQGHEIDTFIKLLTQHPDARIIVNDQYQHSAAIPEFKKLVNYFEPGSLINQVTISFTKDRVADINTGRFIDRDYGVLGYEWLHMLTILAGVLPYPLMNTYLTGDVSSSKLSANFDPRLFVTELTEQTTLGKNQGSPVYLKLNSSILGPSMLLHSLPTPRPPWRQGIRPIDDRQRNLAVHAGDTHFSLHLDPVSARYGWQLDRNHHRLTATRNGCLIHDEILYDSPLENSIRYAVITLLANTSLPYPDITPLRRIAALADTLRSK